MDATNQSDFQHGYGSGIEGLGPDAYESYLSSEVNLAWLNERVTEKRADLDRVTARLTETTQTRQSLFATLQQHVFEGNRAAAQVHPLTSQKEQLLAEQTDLQQRRAAARPDYALFTSLLFVVAGFSFLLGDLIISHEIVAYALNIRNSTEAWAFAAGLAMVSVLLKPAYDRLIEHPYQRDPHRHGRRYGQFKLALVGFSLLTLAVLGWFRYEAYRTDKLKSAINKSIRQLQQNAFSTTYEGVPAPADPALLSQLEAQLRESAALNQLLVNSPWALLSFVLSGLLFALAGAVCLGIGLPAVSAYWFRWFQADRRLRRIRRQLLAIEQQQQPLEATLAEHLSQQTVLQHHLDLLPPVAVLEAEQQSIRSELSTLLAECRLARIDSRTANFNDGLQKGAVARQSLTEAQQQQVRTGYLASQAVHRSPRPVAQIRPYEAIRKVIAEGFGE